MELQPEPTIDNLPPEMLAEIFSRLDLDSIRNARLVSKWWNEMVLFAIRKRFHLVCPISDSTLSRAVKSKEVLKSLNVRNFTGNGNKVVSATRGTGRLFGCADRIQFTGTNINPAKSLKMMSYAFNTVKELIFKRCGHAIIRPLLQSKQFFHSLNQLTIECTLFANRNEPRALGNMPFPDYHAEMPSLHTIKLIMQGPVNGLVGLQTLPIEDIRLHHLAIVKLLVKYKSTLKKVVIVRSDCYRKAYCWLISHRGPENFGIITLSDPEDVDEALGYLKQLEDMTLDQVVIHSEKDNLPWNFEHMLLQGQTNLKLLDITNMRYPPDGMIEQAEAEIILTEIFPQNWTQLKIVKILLALDPEFHPIDLAGFQVCSNLFALELAFLTPGKVSRTSSRLLPMRFKNMQLLPRQIASLYFRPSDDEIDYYPFHEVVVLTIEQVQWIVQNMKNLESFGAHLVKEEEKKEEEKEDGNYPLKEVNLQANVNLETFRNLISMPKLKNLNVLLVQAIQVARVLKDDLNSEWNQLDDWHWRVVFNEYIKMCKGENNPYIKYFTSIKPVFNYVHLKIRK